MFTAPKLPILITGCARTGTSLLTLLMIGFVKLQVYKEQELNPVYVTPSLKPRSVIKYPQGRVTPLADFGLPVKNKNNEIYFLKHYLPSWQVIICVRDAKDILVSHHPMYPEREYYVSPERCRFALERDIAVMHHPNVLLVYYEQLVREPENTMKQVAKFVREKYDFSYINKFYQNQDYSKEMIKALNGIRPIDSSGIGRWREEKHKDRIREIRPYYEANIAPLMKQIGYQD